LNQVSSSTVFREGIIYDSNNLPYFFDNKKVTPLIFNLNSIIEEILVNSKESNNENVIIELNNLMEFIFEADNQEQNGFNYIACNMILEWFQSNIELISSEFNKDLIKTMQLENIFGYVYANINNLKQFKIFLMNDFTPKLNLNKISKKYHKEIKNFKFYEEDFWKLVEPNFMFIGKIFGGLNVYRRRVDEYRRLYVPGKIKVQGYERNLSSLSKINKKYINK